MEVGVQKEVEGEDREARTLERSTATVEVGVGVEVEAAEAVMEDYEP